MTRICLDTSGGRPRRSAAGDIAVAFMTARGMDTDDAKMVRLIAKRTACCMRGLRNNELAVSEDGPGQTLVWRLV